MLPEGGDGVPRGRRAGERTAVGSVDVQSLADLGNSFELVRSLRIVPFTRTRRSSSRWKQLLKVVF